MYKLKIKTTDGVFDDKVFESIDTVSKTEEEAIKSAKEVYASELGTFEDCILVEVISNN